MAELAAQARHPVARALALLAVKRGWTPTLLAQNVSVVANAVVDRRNLARSLKAARPQRATLQTLADALGVARLGHALLDELTAHDAEDIRADVRFAIMVGAHARFRRHRTLWSAVSDALATAPVQRRYHAYAAFEKAAHGVDEKRRSPIDALAQTLGFDLAPYSRPPDAHIRAALAAADELRSQLDLSDDERRMITELLLNHGIDEAAIKRAAPQKTLARVLRQAEEDDDE